jgi:hypothetical protein
MFILAKLQQLFQKLTPFSVFFVSLQRKSIGGIAPNAASGAANQLKFLGKST